MLPTGDPAFASRIPDLLAVLGVLGLLWGHAMALVQVGLRRLVGWLGVGQAGFLALALVDSKGEGAAAVLLGLVASGLAMTGVMATLSSLSHHERACEQIGDLDGMLQNSPLRGGLLALFLLSLGGLPGTIGFVARYEILATLEHADRRGLLVAGIVATVLAMAAIGRPLLAMLRPAELEPSGSRALTNEQFVLSLCGVLVVVIGVARLAGDGLVAGLLSGWIDAAVVALRG